MPLGLVFIQLHVTLHLHHLGEAKTSISLGQCPPVPPGLLYFCSPSTTFKFLLKPLNSSCRPDLPLPPVLVGIVQVEQLRVHLVQDPATNRGHHQLIEWWVREPCPSCSSGRSRQPG